MLNVPRGWDWHLTTSLSQGSMWLHSGCAELWTNTAMCSLMNRMFIFLLAGSRMFMNFTKGEILIALI
jgi:hypothetical protein